MRSASQKRSQQNYVKVLNLIIKLVKMVEETERERENDTHEFEANKMRTHLDTVQRNDFTYFI